MNGDGGNKNHRKRTGSGRNNAGRKRLVRTGSAKGKNSKAAKPARRRRIIKKQFDFSAEISQELAPAKTQAPEASSLISEPASYFDEKYADAKYLSHRKVGDHYYSIYIMPCGPAPRDALMMLNCTSNDRSGAVYLTYENEEQDELRIRIQKMRAAKIVFHAYQRELSADLRDPAACVFRRRADDAAGIRNNQREKRSRLVLHAAGVSAYI